LEEIARIGSGRYYVADDPALVPQIFAKETVTASKSAINEQPFAPALVRPTPVLAGIGLDEAPLLLGYVITRSKATSEVILATEAGDPLLAWWRYGLGVCVAFTSDVKGRWAAEWLGWPEFARFWSQVARHAQRKPEAKGAVVRVTRAGRAADVALDAVDPAGRFANRVATELTLVDPGLATSTLPMEQAAPGLYRASFDASRAGSYQLLITQTLDGQVVGRHARGLAVGYPDELRLRSVNREMLKTVAGLTGGRFDPKPGEVFAPASRPVPRATPLWPYLVAAAALLLVPDVALRRIDLDLLAARARGAGFPGQVSPRTIV
jgi:hypothetical protein